MVSFNSTLRHSRIVWLLSILRVGQVLFIFSPLFLLWGSLRFTLSLQSLLFGTLNKKSWRIVLRLGVWFAESFDDFNLFINDLIEHLHFYACEHIIGHHTHNYHAGFYPSISVHYPLQKLTTPISQPPHSYIGVVLEVVKEEENGHNEVGYKSSKKVSETRESLRAVNG